MRLHTLCTFSSDYVQIIAFCAQYILHNNSFKQIAFLYDFINIIVGTYKVIYAHLKLLCISLNWLDIYEIILFGIFILTHSLMINKEMQTWRQMMENTVSTSSVALLLHCFAMSSDINKDCNGVNKINHWFLFSAECIFVTGK